MRLPIPLILPTLGSVPTFFLLLSIMNSWLCSNSLSLFVITDTQNVLTWPMETPWVSLKTKTKNKKKLPWIVLKVFLLSGSDKVFQIHPDFFSVPRHGLHCYSRNPIPIWWKPVLETKIRCYGCAQELVMGTDAANDIVRPFFGDRDRDLFSLAACCGLPDLSSPTRN